MDSGISKKVNGIRNVGRVAWDPRVAQLLEQELGHDLGFGSHRGTPIHARVCARREYLIDGSGDLQNIGLEDGSLVVTR
jgi:hypothetical protein